VTENIRLIEEETLSHDWGLLKKTTFDLLRRDGTWQRQSRETYDRGNAAAVLLYCLEKKTVVLTRQFRFPVYADGDDGYVIEVVAGLLGGDDPETCARREAEEETGYRITTLRHTFDTYASPGSIIEKISCFLAPYDPAARVSQGGGLEHECEDIEVIELPFDTAVSMIGTGEINDAKTIVLLQHAALLNVFGG
jgi:nudix-type nucleoside diphosphatase (YffH/AdpP family)